MSVHTLRDDGIQPSSSGSGSSNNGGRSSISARSSCSSRSSCSWVDDPDDALELKKPGVCGDDALNPQGSAMCGVTKRGTTWAVCPTRTGIEQTMKCNGYEFVMSAKVLAPGSKYFEPGPEMTAGPSRVTIHRNHRRLGPIEQNVTIGTSPTAATTRRKVCAPPVQTGLVSEQC